MKGCCDIVRKNGAQKILRRRKGSKFSQEGGGKVSAVNRKEGCAGPNRNQGAGVRPGTRRDVGRAGEAPYGLDRARLFGRISVQNQDGKDKAGSNPGDHSSPWHSGIRGKHEEKSGR